jgi:hypothetical protein
VYFNTTGAEFQPKKVVVGMQQRLMRVGVATTMAKTKRASFKNCPRYKFRIIDLLLH